jgi:uncharacterized protein involved in response to NO
MLTLDDNPPPKPFALFNLGFRPFFLLAGLFAIISMLIWMALYLLNADLLPAKLPSILWHGHEMVFGFSMAVISGFLLTAVGNWTNTQTLHGNGLAILCLLWLIARLLPFSNLDSALPLMACIDLLFMTGLLTAILIPIIKTKQWKQLPVTLKVSLMTASNLLFYLGLLEILPTDAIYWGLYSGFYFVIALIMLMGRRVIPFFIEKGIDEQAIIQNWKWLDISSFLVYLIFVIADVFLKQAMLASALAAILFVLHSIRLWGWHAKGIWQKPLLWVLYIGYSFIVLGFGLKAMTLWLGLSPWLSIHAYASGGIGIITAGMMCRVTLGHTGRNVYDPPAILTTVFSLLIAGAVIRVIFPLIFPTYYFWLIAVAQICWISSFVLFIFTYASMLIKPRIDGRFG